MTTRPRPTPLLTRPAPDRPSFGRTRGLDRRRLLALAGGSAAGLAFALHRPTPARAAPEGRLPTDPFTLGIASGDPTTSSVLLWTRLATESLTPTGGLDEGSRYLVRWEVAADPRFEQVVRRGTEQATAEYSFSVHAEVPGLEPDRPYWYRFRAGRHLSPVGRTRTTPAAGSSSALRLAFASCMNYRAGYFQTMQDIADQAPDLVLFLGDYIYEYPVVPLAEGRRLPADLPPELSTETRTLAEYRLRYALYRTDPQLQAAHRELPWVVTWDDHEVSNDYETDDRDDLLRRAAAYRAYWENMPLPRPARPSGPDARLYRRFRWGDLAQIDVLDTRQYRDPALTVAPDEGARRDPARTVLGSEQERWLADGLGEVPARWNLFAQQILFARLSTASSEEAPTVFSPGTWDGYQASQQRMYDLVARRREQGRLRNFVSLGGDVHCTYVSQLPTDSLDPGSAPLGADFTCPSVTSAGDFDPVANEARQVRRRVNPSLRWADLHCGYATAEITPGSVQVDVRVVDRVSDPDSPVRPGRSFAVLDGEPGLSTA